MYGFWNVSSTSTGAVCVVQPLGREGRSVCSDFHVLSVFNGVDVPIAVGISVSAFSTVNPVKGIAGGGCGSGGTITSVHAEAPEPDVSSDGKSMLSKVCSVPIEKGECGIGKASSSEIGTETMAKGQLDPRVA